jgi:hypothetical protein
MLALIDIHDLLMSTRASMSHMLFLSMPWPHLPLLATEPKHHMISPTSFAAALAWLLLRHRVMTVRRAGMRTALVPTTATGSTATHAPTPSATCTTLAVAVAGTFVLPAPRMTDSSRGQGESRMSFLHEDDPHACHAASTHA